MDIVESSAVGMPDDLRQFRELIEPIEAEGGDACALPTKLDHEDREYWARRLSELNRSAYVVNKIAQWIEAETLFYIDRYNLFEELGYDSFAKFLEGVYKSNWGYTLKNAFTVRHRFGIHPGHPLWETLLKIENIQYLESIATIATPQSIETFIRRGAGEGDEPPLRVEAVREIKAQLARKQQLLPSDPIELNTFMNTINDDVAPKTVKGWRWDEIQDVVYHFIQTNKVEARIEREKSGKKVVITITISKD